MGVVFEEPWLDVGIFYDNAGKDVSEHPWGLPWWPTTRLEMYISGFVSTALVLCMFSCSWYSLCRRWEKRAAARAPLAPRRASPAMVSFSPPARHAALHPVPVQPSSTRMIGRPANAEGLRLQGGDGRSRGRTAHGAVWIPSLRDQNEAVAAMIEMGFAYDAALVALQAHNYAVDQAIVALS